MCGREPQLPVDLATGKPPDESMPTTVTLYATALQDRLREVHHQVRHNLVLGKTMEERYDRRATAPPFSECKQLWLHNPRQNKGLSLELQSPRKGQYTAEVISDVTFWICLRPRKRALVVHTDRLWRYHGPGDFWEGRDAQLSSDEEDKEQRIDEDEDQDPGEDELIMMAEDEG